MPTQGSRAKTVTDPKAWLALAHPLRLRISFELQMRDAARATDLANALGVPSNSVSFHLRQLARFGYVEPDDTPRPDRREKWWRSTSPMGFQMAQTEQDVEAAGKLVDVMRQRAHEQLDEWFDAVSLPVDAWSVPLRSTNFDLHLWLSSDERAEFLGELGDVLKKWMAHGRKSTTPAATSDAKEVDPSEEYVLFGYGLPRSAYDEVRRHRNAT